MIFPIRCLVLLLLLLPVTCFASETFHNALSLQGFTGLLNTPNAETTEEGTIYLLYSDQKESKWRDKTPHQDNFMLSFGLFNLLELDGRFFEAPRAGRDLSGSFKVQVPFIPKGDYIPEFALGIQDVSGGKKARLLHTKYAVASDTIWRFRFSVGYGTGPDRMDGIFGGVEAKALDWLYLLAEDDTRERNVGIRLVTPSVFGYPVHLQGTVKTSLDHSPTHPEFAIGLQFPLGLEHNYRKPVPVAAPEAVGGAAADTAKAPAQGTTPEQIEGASPSPATGSEPGATGATTVGRSETALPLPSQGATSTAALAAAPARSLEVLLKRLTDDGFENVRVGSRSNLLVIEYENARYNYNELDAVGVVAGMAVEQASPQYERLRLIEKKKGITMLQLDIPFQELRSFLRDAGNLEQLQSSLKIGYEASDRDGIAFINGDDNSSFLKAYLMLYPGLTTYIGTEISPFDYLLSIKPDLFVDLWKGAVLDARADIPVAWSDNFDDGKRFRGDRHDPRLDRLMIFQAVKPAPSLMATLGGGMVLAKSYGTYNELAWTPGAGNHQVKFSQLYARRSDGSETNEQYLGSYRYFFAPLDVYLQGTGGKFLTGDRGFSAELKRFFGDTAVSVFYKNSYTADGRNHQAGGIEFSLPLTLRRDMKPYPIQVRGSEEWSYAFETAIAKSNTLNFIATRIGDRLEPPFNVDRVFYNRDRLSEDYIRKHLLRLRDAFKRYVVPAEKKE